MKISKQTLIFVFILFIFSVHILHGKTFRTETYTHHIKSLQVRVSDNWEAAPIIRIGGNQQIEIVFDEMSHEYKNLTYDIIHCNADWTPSVLTPIEYIRGFRQMTVEDYLFSFNTIQPYTNYRILFPNEHTQFKVSGNYAALVFDSENPETPLLSACFSIMEASAIPISFNVSSMTDIDFNKEHQQVNFTLNCKNYRITSLQQELKIFVQQNRRNDNMVTNLQPSSIIGTQYVYNHNRQLIFEAGNEYRRFEMTTTAYKGMGIEELDFYDPYYHVTLFRDEFRSKKSYLYDEDQNGRYQVHSIQAENQDSESDYFFVHFSLAAPEPFLEKVYIQSEAFNNLLDARSEMQYNWEKKTYEKTTLLKQGAYNYLYLVGEGRSPQGKTAPIEGNFYETKNEYQILVYHRPLGERYDKLVGTVVCQPIQ